MATQEQMDKAVNAWLKHARDAARDDSRHLPKTEGGSATYSQANDFTFIRCEFNVWDASCEWYATKDQIELMHLFANR